MTRRICKAVAVIGILSGATVQARGGLVVNGGFESGDTTGWTINYAFASGYPEAYGPAHSGDYALELNAYIEGDYDEIYQDIATTVGATYTMSFWLKNAQTQPEYNDFQALWDETTLLDTLKNSPAFDYAQYSFTVTATSATSRIRFRSYNFAGSYYLDDVDVSIQATPVPEPSTFASASAAGLIGLLWGYRHRRRNRAK
jgi:hypothetical protein